MGYNKLKSAIDVISEQIGLMILVSEKADCILYLRLSTQVTLDRDYNGTANQSRDSFGVPDDRGLMVTRGASC